MYAPVTLSENNPHFPGQDIKIALPLEHVIVIACVPCQSAVALLPGGGGVQPTSVSQAMTA